MGATSVLFYIIVYSLTNLGAFGVVAALSSRTGGDDLEDFDGMAKRAPFLSLLMLIFVLSLAGIPPLGGFFGKFYLFASAIQRDSQNFGLLWLVVLGILMSAVSLYYYLVLLKHIYVVDSKDQSRDHHPDLFQCRAGPRRAGGGCWAFTRSRFLSFSTASSLLYNRHPDAMRRGHDRPRLLSCTLTAQQRLSVFSVRRSSTRRRPRCTMPPSRRSR